MPDRTYHQLLSRHGWARHGHRTYTVCYTFDDYVHSGSIYEVATYGKRSIARRLLKLLLQDGLNAWIRRGTKQ
jgi:hypothetical protein